MSGREVCVNPQCEDYPYSHEGMCTIKREPMGTRTGRLSQIPGRPDPVKKPMLIPKGSVIYWNEQGELMMKWPKGDTDT